jgi:cell division protein FtsA
VVEILDLVRRDIEQRLGALELLAGNVVITGGASLMPGDEQEANERFR